MKHLGKENKKFKEPSVKILDKIENMISWNQGVAKKRIIINIGILFL